MHKTGNTNVSYIPMRTVWCNINILCDGI